MKKLYKYASAVLFTGALSLMVVLNADAQRGGSHASGSGSFSRGGGGTFSGGARFGGRSSLGIGLGLGYHSALGYRGGYGLFGYPSLGFYFNTLPYGYYPFYMGSSLFYYYDGIFYRPYDDGYVVTAPPVGAAVPGLPKGSKAIMIDNQQFFEYNGVYYKIVINDKGDKVYVVAGKDGILNTDADGSDDNVTAAPVPHVGDVVNQLPDGSRRVTLNGKKYYVSADDIYFEVIVDKDGHNAYRIVSVPDSQ
ncbi:DUF6515 family protein [Mucilaginibacter sp. UR6-11]|uniref:DUF6515 family protein n=1 Tax=Mucilaginibacter sp. UR6-11 TaxID=1435644 RepID=UPI001E2A0C83|nr:DUF6515 family protein [Mucilaginibacter sp. UR6-11]MCC8427300.1 DUF6515 family protein [Mucilaginibacter sp. UR6-11]